MKWKLLPGLLLSALFLWLAFRSAEPRSVADELLTARYELLIPAVILTVFSFAVRALRWRYLLAVEPAPTFTRLFASTMIGFMANNLLPARLGELLRAHSLGSTTKVTRSGALASIVVERVFDAFVLLGLFGVILLLRGFPPDIRNWGWILLLLAAPALGLLVAYEAAPKPVLGFIGRVLPARLVPPMLRIAGNFHSGLAVLRRPVNLAKALAYSIVMWAALVAVVVFCLHAVGIRSVPVHGGLVVLVIMAIGTMIPSAPGFIGTLQFAGVLALSQLGVDRGTALSFTLIYHASQWLPVTGIGLYFFVRDQMSLRRLPSLRRSGMEADVPIDSMAAGKPAEADHHGG